jgi:hypothetical protein
MNSIINTPKKQVTSRKKILCLICVSEEGVNNTRLQTIRGTYVNDITLSEAILKIIALPIDTADGYACISCIGKIRTLHKKIKEMRDLFTLRSASNSDVSFKRCLLTPSKHSPPNKLPIRSKITDSSTLTETLPVRRKLLPSDTLADASHQYKRKESELSTTHILTGKLYNCK